MNKLEKYDATKGCVKCGHLETIDKFGGGNLTQVMPYELRKTQEFIKRECKNCGYTWYTLPLDAKDEE